MNNNMTNGSVTRVPRHPPRRRQGGSDVQLYSPLWTPCVAQLLTSLLLASLALTSSNRHMAAQEVDEEEPFAKPAVEEAPLPTTAPSSDPAVLALMATKPSTPEELVNAIDTLIDLRAMHEARLLIKQLIDAKLDDAAWAELVEKTGSALFLRLAFINDLQPEGRQVSDAALSAADRRARDPERLAGLIDQLNDPSPAVRRGAMVRLTSGRTAGIQAIVAAMVDPKRAEQRPALRQALVRFGPEAIAPLQSLVRCDVPALELQAILAIGEMGRSELALDLLAPALAENTPAEVRAAARDGLVSLLRRMPDRDEAVKALTTMARRDFDASLNQQATDAQPVEVWQWDAEKSLLTPAELSPLVARLDKAAQRSGDALKLTARGRDARRIYLASLLEAAAYRAEADQPMAPRPDNVASLLEAEDSAVVEDLLDFALSSGHTVAAAQAAQALGDLGKAELLYHREPQPSVLVEAARNGDRRVRFAALSSIIRLKPSKPYPGSSFVIDALGYFAGSFGQPRVLAVDARPVELQTLAGLLTDVGYETDTAGTEREVVAETIASPDYLLALIDFTLAAPTSGQLLERLRRDNRTARLPIGIVASSDDLGRAARLAQRTPLAGVVIRTPDPAALDVQIQRLLNQVGRRMTGPEERRRQAEQAVAWLDELSSKGYEIYNLRRIETPLSRALWLPETSAPAARVLAALGTPTSQQSLLELAGQLTQPLEVRQAAAGAFAASVARFGTLLTSSQINQQYDRYNASELHDEETQRLLAGILDVMEARAAADQAEE